jgi:outer membrane protein assembly factor BamB
MKDCLHTMRNAFRSVTAIAATLLLAQAAWAQHRIALQGNGKLVIVERRGEVLWQFPWDAIHDMFFSPSGTLMVQQGASKVVEIDIAKRKIIWTYDSAASNGNAGQRVEVHAFQPLADGRVMIAESGPSRIIEVNRAGKLLHAIRLKVNHPNPHTDTRLARKLGDDHYLVCHEGDGAVREYDEAGRVIWEYLVPLFGKSPLPGHGPEAYGNKCFATVRLPSGNTLISTGNGHRLIEVTPQQEIVWQIGQHDLPGITLAWVTTIEVLANGHYVIGNCHAGPGQPLVIELDPKTKEVVWTLDRYETFGNSVSTSQILDGGRGVLR